MSFAANVCERYFQPEWPNLPPPSTPAAILDFGNLSLHQAKRQEMEAQVRVLELEAQLQRARVHVSALRKQHYQLAGELEGWEEVDKPLM